MREILSKNQLIQASLVPGGASRSLAELERILSKFLVNRGHDDQREIIADGHFQNDGYFHFHDANGEVATIKESNVFTVDRVD